MVLQELVGKKIIEIRMNKDNDLLIFTTDDATAPLYAYGLESECCSNSYFYEINGIDALRNEIVTAVNGLLWNENPEKCDNKEEEEEVTCTYGNQIITQKGRCDIIFRNESNGWYGGTMEFIDLSKKEPLRFSEIYSLKNLYEEWIKDDHKQPFVEYFNGYVKSNAFFTITDDWQL